MWACPISSCNVLLLSILAIFVRAYNDPSSPNWPTPTQWATLADSLSEGASLNGPFSDNDFQQLCLGGLSDFAAAKQSSGICLVTENCRFDFCRSQLGGPDWNIPAYVLDPRSTQDIETALAFANLYDIEVSIKSTGHSYQGQSTARNSLLIWLANFPKEDVVTTDFVDSCGTSHGPVLGLAGGENFYDALEAVKGNYNVVAGECKSVSISGGWLQGSGLARTSRYYGLGVDQVVEFDVVLANGTFVKADACTNADLFWALRGGGGGTFGVVTHIQYRLYNVDTPIVELNWNGLTGDPNQDDIVLHFVNDWLTYWLQVSPTLDNRWSGGFFSQAGLNIYFFGTMEEAKQSFLNDFDAWYLNFLEQEGLAFQNEFVSELPFESFLLDTETEFLPGMTNFMLPSDSIEEYASWYDVEGGNESFENEKLNRISSTREFVSSRILPVNIVLSRFEETRDLLVNLARNGWLSPSLYYLGGVMMDVDSDATAVHPAMRQALAIIFTPTDEASELVRDLLPNNVTGANYNHHSAIEPDWRNALWGSNYEELQMIKAKYDPENRFNCWHCVGYMEP